jgi:hypothetical protein
LKWRDTISSKERAGFVGAAQAFLSNSGSQQQNLKITVDYPNELDLLKKSKIIKQQNHYIY